MNIFLEKNKDKIKEVLIEKEKYQKKIKIFSSLLVVVTIPLMLLPTLLTIVLFNNVFGLISVFLIPFLFLYVLFKGFDILNKKSIKKIKIFLEENRDEITLEAISILNKNEICNEEQRSLIEFSNINDFESFEKLISIIQDSCEESEKTKLFYDKKESFFKNNKNLLKRKVAYY